MENQKIFKTDDIRWECSRCGLLLGILDRATGRHLRIKVKDRTYWIADAGNVSTGCKRCGAFNQIEDINWKEASTHANEPS